MYKRIVFLLILFLGISFVSALDLTVNNPVQDEIYPSRTVVINLDSDDVANFYYKKDTLANTKWKRLCMMETVCEKRFRFDEGDNMISFKAVTEGGEQDFVYDVSFEVDSSKPRIHTMTPRRGSYIKGDLFSVIYTEDNLQEITLDYGTPTDIRMASRTDCTPGRNQVCNFENVDLTDFDGKEIEYWFAVSDELRTVTSRRTLVNVDTTAPELNYFDYTISRGSATFVFEIKEQNFKDISYIDNNDRNPRWKRLCTRLRDGSCSRRIPFARGEHLLDIVAVDKAGNSLVIEDDLLIIV